MSLRQRRYLNERVSKEDSDRAVAIHHAIKMFKRGESEKEVEKTIAKLYGRDKRFVDRVMKRAKLRLKELKRFGRSKDMWAFLQGKEE